MTRSRQSERILAVKLADLGDVLLCEPALRSLRSAFPDARIDMLVPPTSAELARLLGHGLRVITFPKQLFDSPRAMARPRNLATGLRLALRLRLARYDRVVLLHHLTTGFGARKFRLLAALTGAPAIAGLNNGRGTFLTQHADDLGFGARHEAEYMLAVAVAAGGASVDPAPVLRPPDIRESLFTPDRSIVIFPATGAYSGAREWPAERFATLAARLAAAGHPIVVVGASDATPAAQAIIAAAPGALDVTGRSSIPQLAAIVARARVVVGGDSFVGHLAAALGRPVVSIFGPSNVEAWKPYTAVDTSRTAATIPTGRSRVVRVDLPCAPCFYTGYRLGRRAGCPARTCIELVSVAMVEDAVRAIAEAA